MAMLGKSSLLHLDNKDTQTIRSLRIQTWLLKLNGSMDLELIFFNTLGSIIT